MIAEACLLHAAGGRITRGNSSRMNLFFALLLARIRFARLESVSRRRVALLFIELVDIGDAAILSVCVKAAITALREGFEREFRPLISCFDVSALSPIIAFRLLVAASESRKGEIAIPSPIFAFALPNCSPFLRAKMLVSISDFSLKILIFENLFQRIFDIFDCNNSVEIFDFLFLIIRIVSIESFSHFLLFENANFRIFSAVLLRTIDFLSAPNAFDLCLAASEVFSIIFPAKKPNFQIYKNVEIEFADLTFAIERLIEFAAPRISLLTFLGAFLGFSKPLLPTLTATISEMCDAAFELKKLTILSRLCAVRAFLVRLRTNQFAESRPIAAANAVFRLSTTENVGIHKFALPIESDYKDFIAALSSLFNDSNAFRYFDSDFTEIDSNASLCDAVARAILKSDGAVEIALTLEERAAAIFQCVSCGGMRVYHGELPANFNYHCNRCWAVSV